MIIKHYFCNKNKKETLKLKDNGRWHALKSALATLGESRGGFWESAPVGSMDKVSVGEVSPRNWSIYCTSDAIKAVSWTNPNAKKHGTWQCVTLTWKVGGQRMSETTQASSEVGTNGKKYPHPSLSWVCAASRASPQSRGHSPGRRRIQSILEPWNTSWWKDNPYFHATLNTDSHQSWFKRCMSINRFTVLGLILKKPKKLQCCEGKILHLMASQNGVCNSVSSTPKSVS